MTYIQIITAIGLICNNPQQKTIAVKDCKRNIINCMEQEKQKDKEKIKLYEIYFKTCILKEVKND